MKYVSFTIWIIALLLVTATLDSVQDPPAVNPGTAHYKVPQLADCSCGSALRQRESIGVSRFTIPVSFVAVYACEIYRPSDRTVLTGQAADPSPPIAQTGRTLS